MEAPAGSLADVLSRARVPAALSGLDLMALHDAVRHLLSWLADGRWAVPYRREALPTARSRWPRSGAAREG